MLQKMSEVIRDYRADGRLGAATQPLAGVVAEGMTQTRLSTVDAYVQADDGPNDRLPGQGLVELRHSGGGMGVPSVVTARYQGPVLEETQNLYLLDPSAPMSVSSRVTRVSEGSIEYLEVNGLPAHSLITARAYHLDRYDPCASTVQELTLTF